MGALRAGGMLDRGPRGSEEKALRRLAQLGGAPEELHLIESHLRERYPSREAWAQRLTEIAEFVAAIGTPAARDYFRAIRETGAVAELTDERVLAFARSVDRHTAEWYFWAIWGTKAVTQLTSERVLQGVEFFRSINSPATVEYFLAIRETKAVAELTDERVLSFARKIGSDAAVDYFGTFWETNAVPALTSERVMGFAESIGGDAAHEYFRAIRETKAVPALTDETVLAFVRAAGSRVATDYFRAIRETKAAARLTREDVLLFAELIGPASARKYFQVLASTNAVAALTADGLLRASAVIRSIGADAALDYFLAIAASNVVPSVPEAGKEGHDAERSVPVLTLLDIPTYGGYRAVGLGGVTAAFWLYVWQFSGVPSLAAQGPLAVGLVAGAWVALLGGAYVLLGSIARRSSEQFLERRRRLLNEHGIRWHDCLASDRRCELCWRLGEAHEDHRFDNARFCRCPAC